MAQFASVDELARSLGETDWNEAQKAQGRLALESASALLQSLTRQTLEYVEDDEAVLWGTWDRRLELPERPVVSVSSVAVTSVPGSPLTLSSGEYYQAGPSLELVGGYWSGNQSVTVTYTHGFDPVPDDIRGACLDLAALSVRNDPEAPRSLADLPLSVQRVVQRYRRTTW